MIRLRAARNSYAYRPQAHKEFEGFFVGKIRREIMMTEEKIRRITRDLMDEYEVCDFVGPNTVDYVKEEDLIEFLTMKIEEYEIGD